MMQMYKVFFNNKPVILEQHQNFKMPEPDTLSYVYGSKNGLAETINFFRETTHAESLYIIGNDKTKLIKDFESLFKVIHAAGGVVTNQKDEILFIYRLNKWDLPKGKCEPGESYEETALREVSEECGINNLRIERALTTTMHTYELNGVPVLKKTHWYAMHYSGNEPLIPQTIEHITRASWIQIGSLSEIKANTYSSILDVLSLQPKG